MQKRVWIHFFLFKFFFLEENSYQIVSSRKYKKRIKPFCNINIFYHIDELIKGPPTKGNQQELTRGTIITQFTDDELSPEDLLKEI